MSRVTEAAVRGEENFAAKFHQRWYFHYLNLIIGELQNEALHTNSELWYLNDDEKNRGLTE